MDGKKDNRTIFSSGRQKAPPLKIALDHTENEHETVI